GYSGADLAKLISLHNSLKLVAMYVSENSLYKGKSHASLYPKINGIVGGYLVALNCEAFSVIVQFADAISLCTELSVSVELAPQFLPLGKKVFDLSGGFRLSSNDDYENYNGFKHTSP
ncbi:N-acetyl-gamma-glutamyl-phosphate reductase, partial [Pseudoalteromonas spongiae]